MHFFSPYRPAIWTRIRLSVCPCVSDGTVVLLGRDLLEERYAFEALKLRQYRHWISQQQQKQEGLPTAAAANADAGGANADDAVSGERESVAGSGYAAAGARQGNAGATSDSAESVAGESAATGETGTGAELKRKIAKRLNKLANLPADTSTTAPVARSLSAAAASTFAGSINPIFFPEPPLPPAFALAPAPDLAMRELWKTCLPFPICGVTFGRHVQSAQLLSQQEQEQQHVRPRATGGGGSAVGRFRVPKTLTVTTTKTMHVMIPRFTSK